MDGQRVKQWEARCIEEQPPACTTACPLRVDARGDGWRSSRLATSLPPARFTPARSPCPRCSAGSAITLANLLAAEPRLAERSASRRWSGPASSEAYATHPPHAAIVAQAQARRHRRRGARRPDGRFRPRDEGARGDGLRSRRAPACAACVVDSGATLPPSAIDADVAALAALGVAIHCGDAHRRSRSAPRCWHVDRRSMTLCCWRLAPSPRLDTGHRPAARRPMALVEIDPATRRSPAIRKSSAAACMEPGVPIRPSARPLTDAARRCRSTACCKAPR